MSLSTPATRGPQTQGLNRFSLVAIWTLTGLWVLSNIAWILASGSTRDALTAAGVDLTEITDRLEADGVGSFADAFRNVLAALDRKSEDLAA